jgi:protein O-GlcNAc transferase
MKIDPPLERVGLSSSHLVSFSLWGANPIYNIGAILNAALYRQFLPTFQCVFFHPEGHDEIILQKLREFGAQTICITDGYDYRLFWRFYALDLKGAETVFIRDTDSRPDERETQMVNEFMKSNKNFHIIRDHPAHFKPIMGGMWGAKRAAFEGLPSMRELIETQQSLSYEYDGDQQFLAETVFPLIKHQALVHDEFFDGTNNVPPRNGLRFVGQRFLETNVPEERHLSELAAWELLKSFQAIDLFVLKNKRISPFELVKFRK